MRRSASLVLSALLVALVGCEPCAGTSICGQGVHVSYTGHIVERATQQSVAGARVTFTRTGGIALVSSAINAYTDSHGFFRLAAEASTEGAVIGTLRVAPPGRPSYDVRGLSLQTTTISGDGGNLGRLVADPYIMFIAELRSRLLGAGSGLARASVTFRRTGGIRISQEVIATAADAYGRFYLDPQALEPGTLEGIVTVSAPGFPRSYDIPVQIETRYQDVIVRDVAVLNVGGGLLWAGEVYHRGSNRHVAGIPVDFQRTSGLAVTPERFSTTTNDIGLFAIQPTPLGEGEMVGTVTVHPPTPWAPIVVPNVRVYTFDSDIVRLATRIPYGAQAFGAIELRYRTTMTPVTAGAAVVFRRTGGVPAQPDSSADIVNSFGFAPVLLGTEANGDVIGDIEVQLGEPYGTQIIRGVRVKSSEDDIQRFLGTYPVGRWFPQVAHLADSATGRAIPGARVVFTREDGVPFTPNPYIVIPNADGYFGIRPQPLADGDVVGTLTFELPAPYPSASVRGIHLQTSTNDTLRFIGTWLFAKPK